MFTSDEIEEDRRALFFAAVVNAVVDLGSDAWVSGDDRRTGLGRWDGRDPCFQGDDFLEMAVEALPVVCAEAHLQPLRGLNAIMERRKDDTSRYGRRHELIGEVAPLQTAFESCSPTEVGLVPENRRLASGGVRS